MREDVRRSLDEEETEEVKRREKRRKEKAEKEARKLKKKRRKEPSREPDVSTPVEGRELTPEEELERMKAERLKRREAAKKRVMRNRIILAVVVLCIIGLLLFRFLVVAKTVEVENNTPYEKDKILSSMDVGYGSFLYSFNSEKIEKSLQGLYPYIKNVEVKTVFPSTVKLKISSETKKYSIENGKAGYLCTTDRFKVLEVSKTPVEGTVVIKGTDPGTYELGYPLKDDTFIYEELIGSVINECTELGIKGISTFDMTKKFAMTLYAENGIVIKLGDSENLDKKFKGLELIIDKNGLEKAATISVENYKRPTYALTPEVIIPPSEDVPKEDTEASEKE